jgi:hypothetical protein
MMAGILLPIDEVDCEARHGDRHWDELAFVQLRTAEAAMTLRSMTGAIDAIITVATLAFGLSVWGAFGFPYFAAVGAVAAALILINFAGTWWMKSRSKS